MNMGKTVARLATIVSLLALVTGSLMGKTTEQELADSIVTWAKTDIADGKCLTPFQQTVENIKAFLFSNNTHAYTMEEIVAGIEHHYKTDATARNSLRVWIDAGLVQGIMSTIGKTDTTTRYYLDWVKRRANLPGAKDGR